MALTFNHGFSYYENDHQSSQGQLYEINNKSFENHGDHNDHDHNSPTKNFSMSNSSSLSSPTSSNSSGLGYQQTLNYHHHHHHQSQSDLENNSVINFQVGSLLSFDQRMSNHQEDSSIWEDNIHHGFHNHHQQQLNSKSSNPNLLMLENPNKMQIERRSLQFGVEDIGKEEGLLNKRPYSMEENTQPNKKQCTSPTKQLTPKSSPAKDPQSLAAKNRREKISERLKVLQELVPNGSKVDMVTMLEKAIGYVKFLQLQVKVLATDEFWPAQGGKAPNLSQVKEAIDVILASQRDRN